MHKQMYLNEYTCKDAMNLRQQNTVKKTNELTINMNMKSTLYTRRHNNTNMLTTKWFQSRNIKHLSDLLVQGTSSH